MSTTTTSSGVMGGAAVSTSNPPMHLSPDVAAEIAAIVRGEVRGELRHEERLRHLEQSMAGIQATLTAAARPPFWPQVVGAILGVGGTLIALVTLVVTSSR